MRALEPIEACGGLSGTLAAKIAHTHTHTYLDLCAALAGYHRGAGGCVPHQGLAVHAARSNVLAVAAELDAHHRVRVRCFVAQKMRRVLWYSGFRGWG